jgi:Major capsid protein 13-like
MTDTPTKVADVIEPEVFNPYFREMTTRVNAFFQSGIVQTVPDVSMGDQGGTQVQMPFWQALGERAQLLDDTQNLVIKKITTAQDTAVLHARALVYGASDLSAALAGDDPMEAIAAGVGENWSYEFNMCLIATLKGAFAALLAESPDVNVLDISGLSGTAAYIDGASFIDAAQLLGDHKDRIVGILMHSAVEAHLAKNDLIETIRDSEGNILMKSFMGKRVIVDDANTPTATVHDTYLFGPGAIGFAETEPKVPSETNRDPLIGGGQEYLVTRRHYVLHPRGIRWTPQSGVPALTTPSDAELAAAANWTRVYEPKNVRMVRLQHKVS